MQNDTKAIKKNDPDFPEHLNFEVLRKTGLEYIGKLSGKIWTDHNVHDPGVTMLEMLCYALMDLGYRSNLPVEDLFALNKKAGRKEDNFFTPAQILSCNPVTILDFRKALINIEGVRNAWLELADEAELSLEIFYRYGNSNQPSPELRCINENEEGYQNDENRLILNGLYKVYIELENKDPLCLSKKKDEVNRDQIIQEVWKTLNQYRNLCEDFLEIRILCQEEIGVCAEVELTDSADPDKVYVQIMQAIFFFLTPQLRFYTLQEMLEKGKSIEEVFEGRPYSQESFGFIDTEELEKLERRKEIHLSDLYQVLLEIDGVKSVKNLDLSAYINGGKHKGANTLCGEWIHQLAPDHVPVFCIDRSCLKLYKGFSGYKINKEKLNSLIRETLTSHQKGAYTLAPEYLDNAPPKGNYRADLGDYYSIQHEFPRVYGIGEGGLAEDVSTLRKSQALQLKGYLLFFDQLLSGYLSQLFHLRDLFSMSPDSNLSVRPKESAHTYFNQRLSSVPQIEKLIRFYTDNFGKDIGWANGTTICLPMNRNVLNEADSGQSLNDFLRHETLFGSQSERNAAIEQFRREFEQGEFKLEIIEEECGFFFILLTSFQQSVLLSKQLYASVEMAKQAADALSLLASLQENYSVVNRTSEKSYSFELTFQPVDYLQFLQHISEDERLYQRRRNEFLDHLLARFSENFNEYALLMYGQNGKDKEKEKLEHKARFLSAYDEIGRNRGKAYDYRLNGWDTPNVSGLERRVAALSGIKNPQRKDLCNFELFKYQDEYLIEIKDLKGEVLFTAREKYPTEEEAKEAFRALQESLAEDIPFQQEDHEEIGEYRLLLPFSGGILVHPAVFHNPEEREKKIKVIRNLWSEKASDENIKVSRHIYKPELQDAAGRAVRQSRKQFSSETKADAGIADFVEKVNTQLKPNPELVEAELQLISHPASANEYLDKGALANHVRISGPLYRWEIAGKGKVLCQSIAAFEESRKAEEAFVEMSDLRLDQVRLEREDQEEKSLLYLVRQPGGRLAHGEFKNQEERDQALNELQDYLDSELNGEHFLKTFARTYRWEMIGNGESGLQSSLFFPTEQIAENAWKELKTASGKKNKISLRKEEEAGKFRLILSDAQGEIIARSPFEENDIPEENIQHIRSLLGQDEHVRVVEAGQAYGFQIPHPDKPQENVLESYALHTSRLSAFNDLQEALKILGRKNAYKPYAAEENRAFSFYLKNKKIIARHPSTYATEAERNSALQESLEALKKYNFPIRFPEEYKGELSDKEGKVLLQAAKSFSSSPLAEKDLYTWLPLAIDPLHYQSVLAENENKYSLRLTDNGNILAYAPELFEDEKSSIENVEKIRGLVRDFHYKVVTEKYPYRWKFLYWWESPSGELEPLLESTAEYESEDLAREQYQELIRNIDRLIPTDQDHDGVGFKFLLNDQDFAGYPRSFSSAGKKEQVLAEARKELAAAKALRLSSAEAADPFITSTSRKEGGKWVYRVLKKSQPLAYYPCKCFSDNDGDEIEGLFRKLYEKAVKGYAFLEICMGGNIYLEIENRIHFLIRDKHTASIYFISYQGYATEKEAEKAFNENYLQIIKKASDAGNYGAGKAISFEPPTEDPFCSQDNRPLVFIPKSVAYTTGQLVDIACSYPIRLVEKEQRGQDCKKIEISRCYDFHLVGDDPECKLDWKSTACYDSPEEAMEAFHLLLLLLQFKGSLKAFLHDEEVKDEMCCYRIGVTEILLESKNRFIDRAAAWSGLDDLLERACEDKAFCREWDEEACCYRFFVVGQDYYLATHPYSYHSPQERKKAIHELVRNCTCQEEGRLQIKETPGPDTERWGFSIEGADGTLHWQSAATFSSAEDSQQQALVAIQYATEDRFYMRQAGKTLLLKRPLQKVMEEISRNEGSLDQYIMAEHPANILEQNVLLQAAIHYPFMIKESGYGFKLYCNSFEIPVEGQSPDDCPKPEQLIGGTSTGGVVWTSEKEYATLQEAGVAFDRFCSLLKDKNNYKPAEEEFCGPYGLVLVDPCPIPEYTQPDYNTYDPEGNVEEKKPPQGIMAFHPQCYERKTGLEKAIMRTKECLENEGLHLVEHILLRPRKESDCQCLPPIYPDPNCVLPYELPEEDFCKQDEIQRQEPLSECEEESKLMAQYIPGSDPYSFWATLILPCWTKRFRSHSFREAFQDLVIREAPAHVAFRIFWVSPEQMCEFESLYKRWMKWMAQKKSCVEGNALCDFVEILFGLKDCPPVLEEEEEEDPDCSCQKEIRINLSNFLIKNSLSYDRERIYDQDFIKNRFAGTARLNLLNRKQFGDLFNFSGQPKESFSPVPDPVSDPGFIATPAPVRELNEEEVAKRIRQRLASYQENIKNIEDQDFQGHEDFKRTEYFLLSEGQPNLYRELAERLIQKLGNEGAGETESKYYLLLSNASWFFLDKMVLKDKNHIPPETENALTKILEGKNSNRQVLNQLREHWNGEELKALVQANVVDSYLNMLQ